MADIEVAGEITGAADAAAAVVGDLQAQADEVESALAGTARVTCFYETFYPPLYTVGPGTFIYDLLERAGCDPVTSSAGQQYPQWSVEDLVAESPDVYLVSSESGAGPMAVAKRAGFEAVGAVAAGRVVAIDSSLAERPGPEVDGGAAADRRGAPPRGLPLTTMRRAVPYRRVILALVAALIAAFLVGVAVGAVWISPVATIRLIAWKLGLTGRPDDVSRAAEVIVFQLRLPRVLLAAIVGGALAASGAVFQGLFRNPLADPAIIGVSSGAALGAVVVIVTVGAGSLGAFAVPLAAFVGAIATAFVVYRLARIGPAVHVATLLLAGIAIAAVISSFMSLVMSFSGEEIRDIYAWLLGGLVAQGWRSVEIVLPVVAVGVAGAWLVAHELNLISLGEERAAQLGVDLDRLKRTSIAVGALLAAAAVSVAGVIGFVGLMTPHLLRLVIGSDHRRLVPASVLGGATLLILADLIARTIVAPSELPVGVVTALIGGPFFIYLMRREGKKAGARV